MDKGDLALALVFALILTLGANYILTPSHPDSSFQEDTVTMVNALTELVDTLYDEISDLEHRIYRLEAANDMIVIFMSDTLNGYEWDTFGINKYNDNVTLGFSKNGNHTELEIAPQTPFTLGGITYQLVRYEFNEHYIILKVVA